MSPAAQNHPTGPLRDVRVLDLTRVLAGPWTSQLLGDYGADVIKVEKPGQGDDTRGWGPPWLANAAGEPTSDSAYFLSANRNKRSVCIDLGQQEGAAIVRALAARSDVILENFRSGTMDRFGLGYEELAAVNPGLVYCSITAYGQTGSRAARPGYDAMIQASGGLMSITGDADGPPQKVGVAIADIMAGMYAATAVLAALCERRATGSGQYIDVPLYDTQVAWLANQAMNFLAGGQVPGRLGTAHPNLVPYQAFATADGYLMLAVGSDRQFADCVACLGLPEAATDERFATNAARVANRQDLVDRMAMAFAGRTTAHWLHALGECRVPAGPIRSIDEVFTEPYAAERPLVQPVVHRHAGTVPTVANPVRFSASPVDYRMAPPLLGEHTREVLAVELGYTSGEIDRLVASGTVQVAT